MNSTADVEQKLYETFVGTMGITAAQVFASFGAAYGIARSAIGITHMGVMKPELVMKSIIPVVMAGIISIYGLVVSIILSSKVKIESDPARLSRSFAHLAAGLTCGVCGLGAGYAIGVVGEVATRAFGQQPRLFIGMVLILIFAEVLGLYGLIVALIVAS